MQAIVARLADRDASFFPRLTALYGLHRAGAVLAWLIEARALIAQHTPHQTIQPRGEEASGAATHSA